MSSITSTKEELEERIKELSCLYEISSVIRQHNGEIEGTLKIICQILRQAWRFPEDAIVEMQLDDFRYSTRALPEVSICQQTQLIIFDEPRGFIKTHYPKPQFLLRDFLVEEQKLLNKISEEVSAFYEKQLRKEQEELLKRTAERNDRLTILGEITAGIAHELNTPLGNILGFAELINNRTEHELTKQDTSRIIKAAMISREVVKKLMFFACEMPQKKEIIKIVPVVSQALSLLEPNFRKAKVEYRLEVENDNLQAQLDSIQLTQVLFNLLINALYVSPEDTVINLKLRSDDKDLILDIVDQGSGIDEKVKQKIFEPFFTTKPVGEGSGLGLSVVHGIIKSHRGEITVFDNHPTGAGFRIKLPLKN